MKLQLLSDLHLEAHPHFQPTAAPDAEVLVLAGDIGSYQEGGLLQDEYFGLERFSPLPQFASWPCPVIFVPGNHEYDMQDWDVAHARLRRVCDALGIIWLERESLVLNQVRFVGTTLWTDYDAIALLDPQVQAGDVGRLLKQREKSFRAANFYLRKTGGTRHGQPFLAEPMREQALVCQDWLRHALQQPFAGKTVAITHFAPSLQSHDPRYGLVPGTAGFCNALDDLLAHADLWLHGHLHAPSDYQVQGLHADGSEWRCRVVANPLGYARKGEQGHFLASACITL
ncbi:MULTISPECIES: metallophosphoesterase [Comamonas]|uniref:Metallophosphoesterase n=1 Tax=Comamonas avium TaxID=2762231 RepID=A0ABR8S883_9BURK|nr:MULTISPECIES: metallophosphoesterase [Comamonas]MBD7959599.1 metallophosphoesterase [Comamonas avium]MBD9403064.1 metallophosphoesterase [Comamonas sp. CMM02]